MHKSIQFPIAVTREAAATLTDPATDLADRHGYLVELVEAGQVRARARTHHQVLVTVLAVAPAHLAEQLRTAPTQRRRRAITQILLNPRFLFCGARLADETDPALAYGGVPLRLVEDAQDALARAEAIRYAPVVAVPA